LDKVDDRHAATNSRRTRPTPSRSWPASASRATLTTGVEIRDGELGENITTTGVDLIGLPVGSMLRIGDDALVALTGLRNPCHQIRDVGDGVLKMMFVGGEQYGLPGEQVGRTGVMGVVVAGGVVSSDDTIEIRYPAGTHPPIQKV
jgi:MOSC domain-containing protein YiiM